MIYEMMFGFPPFNDKKESDKYQSIISGDIDYPPGINAELKDIVKCLCMPDQSKRLGRNNSGTKGVMQHLWFSGFSFESVRNKFMESPFKPKIETGSNSVNSKSEGSKVSVVYFVLY